MQSRQQELIAKIVILEADKNQQLWINLFCEIFSKFKINNNQRICHFFAQVMHESAGLSTLEENLQYSKQNLLKIFPKYFYRSNTGLYVNNKEAIANKVYANRMGNGNEDTGDGYRFRGRGIIQTTGKENYRHLNRFFQKTRPNQKINLMENPSLLAKNLELATEAACFFWHSKKLNTPADQNDIVAIRKSINGGLNGIEDCKNRLEQYLMLT
jgi:putative chitinase